MRKNLILGIYFFTSASQALALTQGPEAKQLVQDFKLGNIYKILVVSYETLRKHVNELAGVCGLLVCDEGHRYLSRKYIPQFSYEKTGMRLHMCLCACKQASALIYGLDGAMLDV